MTWIPKPEPKHRCYDFLPKSELAKRATHNWKCDCGRIYAWRAIWDQREGESSYWEKIA